MEIKDQILGDGEYFAQEFKKDTIYLHHTAGSHRPDWVISGWNTDDDPKTKSPRAVATAFVIGGKSTTDGDVSFDGKVYRAFNEKFWAHHLGTKQANNAALNKASIGIEICNYGPLTIGKDGKFYNYVNKPVPADQVVKLDKPFRGYSYYHKYTDAQISAVKELILSLKAKFRGIRMKTPLLNADGFEFNNEASKGLTYGILSHSNVRKDKFDLYPDNRMIEMLKTVCK